MSLYKKTEKKEKKKEKQVLSLSKTGLCNGVLFGGCGASG